MKLSQLIESFVISNDEFEDYLDRATEQLTQELQSGKNPRDAVHDLALTFADQHNKSYDAYTRMSDSLSARMHTLELDGSTSTEIAPADMTNGPEMSDMGAEPEISDMGAEPEMMTDPMGDMEMAAPEEDDMPSDGDMEDYAAVMDNSGEEEMNESACSCDCGETPCKACGQTHHDVSEAVGDSAEVFYDLQDAFAGGEANGAHRVLIDELVRYLSGDQLEDFVSDFKRHHDMNDMEESAASEKARERALAKADEPERGEERKKVSVKKAPWEESVDADAIANRIVGNATRQSFSEYNEFYKALDGAAKAGKKAGDTIEVGGKKIKLKSNPKQMDQLSDAEMDKIDALARRLNEKRSCKK